MKDWYKPAVKLPREGVEVLTMDSTGHVRNLVFRDRLWWLSDFSMYVYYVPKFWTEIEEKK